MPKTVDIQTRRSGAFTSHGAGRHPIMIRLPTVFSYEHEPVVERPRSAAASEGDGPSAGDAPVAWKLKRDPPRAHDSRLSPLAIQWFEDLPTALKPAALCERFPRIANRLAIAWKDATLAELLLQQLLEDRRGGRKGFPLEIRVELIRLAAEVKVRKSAPAFSQAMPAMATSSDAPRHPSPSRRPP